jgi:predicted DNA-binding transcriptional regulator AlpA
MQERKLDYPKGGATYIRKEYLKIVDTILLAYLGRKWEEMRDIRPFDEADMQNWTRPSEDLRTSPLGQSLLLIADYATNSMRIEKERVERAIKRVCRMVYGDPLSEAYHLPPKLHKNDLGHLLNAAYRNMYSPNDLLTPKQAYTLVGVVRQSLYDRYYDGKLTPVYWYDDLRFLRSEIEEWKTQREKHPRKRKTKPEQGSDAQ